MKKTSEKPKQLGRPLVKASKINSERIEIKVTPAQKKILTAAADRDGKTLANWIRSRLGIDQAEYRRVG